MPSLKKKKSKKAKANAPVNPPAEPIIPSAPQQSPTASPHPSTDASPRESPFKRLLRRSTSSLGDSWRGLKNRRRESVSSVVASPGTGMGMEQEGQGQMTPSRSRGSEVFVPSPDAGAGRGTTSRSGSTRSTTTPLRPRQDPAESAESTKSHHHRVTSSISSLTTFPTPNPATPVKGTAGVKESNVAAMETIASSRDQPVPSGQSAHSEGAATGAVRSSGPGEERRPVGSLGLNFTPAREPIVCFLLFRFFPIRVID